MGCSIKDIQFVNMISCPEGIQKLNEKFPELTIYTAQLDEYLNEDKYIIPGIGDMGDRFYNTLK